MVQSFNHVKQKQVICQESTLLWSNVMIEELGGIEPGGIPPKSLIINFYLFNSFTFHFLTLKKKKINSRIEIGSCFINSQSQWKQLQQVQSQSIIKKKIKCSPLKMKPTVID